MAYYKEIVRLLILGLTIMTMTTACQAQSVSRKEDGIPSLATLPATILPPGNQANCEPSTLETCTRQLLRFSSDEIEVPKTSEEVRSTCGVIKNGTKCIRKYMSNCAPPVIRQMSKMAMGGVTRTINKRCSEDGILLFLSHRDCIRAIKHPAQQCYRNLVRDMYRIRGASNEQLHPSVCCFLSKMHECNSDSMRKNCKEESQEYYGQEIGKLMDEMLELICPANLRWGLKECQDIDSQLPDTVDIPEGEDISILPLIMDLMKRLTIE